MRFDDPAEIRVSVAFNFYVSVFALLCDGAGELRQGVARSPAAKAAESLTVPARRALTPIVAPGYSLCPDCLSPDDPTGDTALAEEIERLRSLTVIELRQDLERTFGGTYLPDHWARVWDQPRRWAHGFAAAVEQFGAALEPTWRRSGDQRHQEAERIGVAVARGAADVALAGAHARGALRGSVLEFPDEEGVEIDATGKRIALTPMVGRPPCVAMQSRPHGRRMVRLPAFPPAAARSRARRRAERAPHSDPGPVAAGTRQ